MALTADPGNPPGWRHRDWVSQAAAPVVGREPQLAILANAVAAVRQRGAAFLVVGEPGVGVSTVLRAAGDQARSANCTILTYTGSEAESDLPFAALQRLIQPQLRLSKALPPVQRRALQTTFAMASGAPPDPFLVALGTLTLLTEYATTRPVVVIVDDVQWMDTASRDVLTFVARRLSTVPVVLIGGLREGYSAAQYGSAFVELALPRLDDHSARKLLADAGTDLTDDQRNWILAQSFGNPLALVELSATPAAIGDLASPQPWISGRLEKALIGRLSDLPVTTRDALLIASTGDTNSLSEILQATGILCGGVVTAAVLDPAEQLRLLRFDEVHVEFRHPLIPAAITLRASVASRRAAHSAWATALMGMVLSATATVHTGDGARSEAETASADSEWTRSTRGIWHRARAAAGPDDSAADDLELVAAGSADRGDISTAVTALEKSAQLTTPADLRARRLLLAAEHATSIGRVQLADRLVSTARREGISGVNILRAELLREAPMASVTNNVTQVARLCEMSEQAVAAGERDLALKALMAAAQRCWWASAPAPHRARVAELAHQFYRVHPEPRCIVAMAMAEPIRRGTQVMTMLDDLDISAITDGMVLRVLGLAAHSVGDQVRADELSARAEMTLRRQGRLGALGHALGVRSTARLDLGDWDGAVANSAEGASLAREAGQLVGSAGATVNRARYLALQGDSSAALRLVAEVEHDPLLQTLDNFLCRAQIVRAIAWISAGRHADAYRALRHVFDTHDPSHHEREQIGGIMYLAEAAAGCNQRVEARKIVAAMERLAGLTASPLLVTQLLYARPLLADDADAERLYLTSLAHDLSSWPWVRARIQLAFGSWLRRQRRNSDARRPLRSALSTFDQLGASAWSALARGELDATGERRELPDDDILAVLSAQELQITVLAAQGLSNSEIGQRLRLSPRTVSSHLYRIFPKLDITSRAQIAGRLGQQTPDAANSRGRRNAGAQGASPLG